MPQISFDSIKAVVQINGKDFHMYSGFLPSSSLKTIAEVPSFPETKPHHQIATDIFTPPVDQWQRPLDKNKTNKIKEVYSMTTKDNIMANPVLIGVAYPNLNDEVKLDITQKSVTANDGSLMPIPGVFTVTVNYNESKKPLWILDGQHRIVGMNLSVQTNQPMPFVLLYHPSNYPPPFLAEIFTQVTTGATPMKSLHSEWMQYAFDLGKYDDAAHKRAMETTIYLAKETSFGTVTNVLHNKIQFNPYLPQPGYGSFSFNMQEWENIILKNYYGSGGTATPVEIAAQIIYAITALEVVDNFTNRGSKLFSINNHSILGEAFLYGILNHLVIGNSMKSVAEWTAFFSDSQRKFDTLDWSLPFIRSSNAMSGSTTINASREIAKRCFNEVLNNSTYSGRPSFTDMLEGINAQISITAFPKTSASKLSRRNPHSEIISVTGTHPFYLNDGNSNREFITIQPQTQNCHILAVRDATVVPAVSLNKALSQSGLDVSSFPNNKKIEVEVMHYSSDTKKVVEIRLDK